MQYLLSKDEYDYIFENFRNQVTEMCLTHVKSLKRRCPMISKDGICDYCDFEQYCTYSPKVWYSD